MTDTLDTFREPHESNRTRTPIQEQGRDRHRVTQLPGQKSLEKSNRGPKNNKEGAEKHIFGSPHHHDRCSRHISGAAQVKWDPHAYPRAGP